MPNEQTLIKFLEISVTMCLGAHNQSYGLSDKGMFGLLCTNCREGSFSETELLLQPFCNTTWSWWSGGTKSGRTELIFEALACLGVGDGDPPRTLLW
jgi:hypothetical protein